MNIPEDASEYASAINKVIAVCKDVEEGFRGAANAVKNPRGEDFSIGRYRDALSHPLPATLRSLLETQYQQVQRAHGRIKELRDTSAKQGNAVA